MTPHRSERRPGARRAEQKNQQLCRQAYRALVGALAGECGDPVLQDLTVLAVTPAPDAGRLVVDVCPGGAAAGVPPHEVLRRLDLVHGMLRHAVAMAVVRKRAPELVFRCCASGPLNEGGVA